MSEMEKTAKKETTAMYVAKLGLILFTITAITALLLGFVNSITKDKIAAVKDEELKSTMSAFFADADSFPEQEGEFSSAVSKAYIAKKGDEVLGVCVNVQPLGFKGPVETLVGVDLEGKVIGAKILDHEETAGLGANAEKDSFIVQYKGKAGPFTVVKGAASAEGDIVALSGATITSKAVTEGVYEAVKTATSILSQIK